MPVRIYDIARRLGVENKVVLAKAKDLGISGARVPSSSLDKITAEYLEEQLMGEKPPPVLKETSLPPTPEPILVVKAPEPEPEEAPADQDAGAGETGAPEALPATQEPPHLKIVGSADNLRAPAEAVAAEAAAAGAAATELVEAGIAKPAATAEDPAVAEPEPEGPKIGEKVGFIQLPTRPAARGGRSALPTRGPAGRSDTVAAPRSRSDVKDARFGARPASGPAPAPARPAVAAQVQVAEGAEVITLKPPIIVRDLAEKLNRKPYQLIADLIELKVMATVNQAIDEETARRLCAKYGFRFDVEKRERGGGIVHSHVKKVELTEEEDEAQDLKPRAPVVTIMGHVDHGKTTLLDVIRKTDVAAGEAGGITQHIGAYTIAVSHPDRKSELQQITFLDTPGHAAFSAMRARGADVTDIVILVVAANDGVMPQTVEAISHAKAAEVPILVAVNKSDHPGANPMRVRQQLQEKGLVPDDWGGETIFVDVSALTRQGVDKLLEMIVLQADLLELKANPNRPARGNVIESGLSAGGPTASVLVRAGTLKVGQTVICGSYWGRVRALIDDDGKRMKEAGPSMAVKVLGLNGVPDAGAEFNVVLDEKAARALVDERKLAERAESRESRGPKVDLNEWLQTLSGDAAKELKVVVKADTQGSVEAIVDALKKIESEKIKLQVIHFAVGTVTETDVHLASASKALILGFHTRIDNGVAEAAKREGVQIKLYSIIYELIDQVKDAMAGMLDPEYRETMVGQAEVRQIFELSKGGNVAGCVVNSGRIVKGKARVMRRKGLIFEGIIQSLRRFQDEVNEVRSGIECGLRMDGFNDFQPGDLVECYSHEQVAAKL